MNAYDIVWGNFQTLKIANFNIMSHLASKFSIPNSAFIHSEGSGESRNDWKMRYQMIIHFLSQMTFDILCLEEVTQEFYNMLPVSFNAQYHIIFTSKPNNLLTMVNRQIAQQIHLAPIPNFQHSKLSSLFIQLVGDERWIKIVNAHLIGDPTKHDERVEIIQTLMERGTIIIGDFNESVDDLIKKGELQDYLDKEGYKLDNQNNLATAYSRYNINPAGFVTGIKPEPWEAIDNVVYDGNIFRLVNKEIFPNGGLEGHYVPYAPSPSEAYKYIENFDDWLSDHSLNCYYFLLF